MMGGSSAVLVAACLASAAAWTWSPMVLPYVRPRRNPVPFRPVPPSSPQGVPLYPARVLAFSGYLGGAGMPQLQQGVDPYPLAWGSPLSSRSAHQPPCDAMCKSVQDEPPTGAADPTESPEIPLDEAALGSAAAATPTAEPVAEATPTVTDDGGDDRNSFERRAKQDPARKEPKPSYPAPAPGPPRVPTAPTLPAPAGPGSSSGGDDGDDSDRGGYGTINAWFPFMFSGGWPMGGPSAGGARGYGAPNNSPPSPSYGAPNNSPPSPSYGAPNNAPPSPSYGASNNAPPSPSYGAPNNAPPPSNSGPAADRPSPSAGYYPVAIANSFSTGRNAVASSTATAYGNRP